LSPKEATGPIVAELRAAGCVFPEEEARLLTEAAGSTEDLVALVGRRVAGQPLEHVVGWAEFCGLRIGVDPGVFVPRQRTAVLARWAAGRARAAAARSAAAQTAAGAGPGVTRDGAAGPGAARADDRAGAVVIDLCCGSGAVAAAVATLTPGVRLHAVDIDPAAVRCARRNLAGTGAHVYHGDLFRPLPRALRGRVDVLVANAPYVPSAAIDLMPPEARLHEPAMALDGGTDGLDVLRRVIAAAPVWLAPGGCLLVEAGDRQAPPLAAAMEAAGLRPAVAAAGDAAIVSGTLTRPAR
jgi:release factor glutamine methyltransferase